MESSSRKTVERIKIACLAGGVRVSPGVLYALSDEGRHPLTVHEYATTGGLTFILDHDVFINAPFDDWYCDSAAVELALDDSSLVLRMGNVAAPIRRLLPLPGYLDVRDSDGRLVSDVCMSHADRIRLSPIAGCAYNCSFCDIPMSRYERHPAEQLLAAMETALADSALPPRHLLISGGSPGRRDTEYFEQVCTAIVAACPLPVDIMMASLPDVGFIDRMVDRGVHGFSLNIELFGDDASRVHIRGKHAFARPGFDAFVQRAVDRLGRHGHVRSLILVGLERPEETLAGVEHLAGLGADPVLSPFRPARNTPLHFAEPPAPSLLHDVLQEARTIVARHGVRLGPRCIPCQHNTLTFPWDVAAQTSPVATSS